MERKSLFAGIVAGAVIASGVGALTSNAAPLKRFQLVNVQFMRLPPVELLPDGGGEMSWGFRACGYEFPLDGGLTHDGEPCWNGTLHETQFLGIETSIVSVRPVVVSP